jgi:hypothetical protein
MERDKFAKEILKTGFVLENRIAIELKRSGWTVISNKYYEDDLEGNVREIDLLAYKVSKMQHFDVYTTLLISCKKSESNVWALLARDINLKDPNSDWWPLHTWSNDKALLYELSQPGRARAYHNDVAALGVTEALSIPSVDVFAFQEMNRSSGAPQNDKNIFNALTSLMKAQSYELSALPRRKKLVSVYQFNLLSIIDSDLIRLNFIGNEIEVEPVNSEHYIARYIIRKTEIFSRIHFIKASYFEKMLTDYDRLHNANCKWFDQTYNNFFDGIAEDSKRTEVLIEEFRDKLRKSFFGIVLKIKRGLDVKDISLNWLSKQIKLAVTLPGDSEFIKSLNQNDKAKETVAEALKEVYRYTGDFFFSEDEVPF